jgi:hypothetical protein
MAKVSGSDMESGIRWWPASIETPAKGSNEEIT